MANETMRIFFSLKIITYPQDEYGLDDNPVEITPAEALTYEDAILAAIAKENRLYENDRALAEYIHDEALNEKVYSLYPSVEIVDGELWGVMTADYEVVFKKEDHYRLRHRTFPARPGRRCMPRSPPKPSSPPAVLILRQRDRTPSSMTRRKDC